MGLTEKEAHQLSGEIYLSFLTFFTTEWKPWAKLSAENKRRAMAAFREIPRNIMREGSYIDGPV